jgi:hypothetical protein
MCVSAVQFTLVPMTVVFGQDPFRLLKKSVMKFMIKKLKLK